MFHIHFNVFTHPRQGLPNDFFPQVFLLLVVFADPVLNSNVKFALCFINHHAMNTYMGVEV
jgi:hypothetical protein